MCYIDEIQGCFSVIFLSSSTTSVGIVATSTHQQIEAVFDFLQRGDVLLGGGQKDDRRFL